MEKGLTAALMAVKGSNSNRKVSGAALLAGEEFTKEKRAQESDIRVYEKC